MNAFYKQKSSTKLYIAQHAITDLLLKISKISFTKVEIHAEYRSMTKHMTALTIQVCFKLFSCNFKFYSNLMMCIDLPKMNLSDFIYYWPLTLSFNNVQILEV